LPREFTNYIPLHDALELLKRNAKTLPRREVVPVGESFGRVLFEDVASRVDIPATDSSHMDGFAVRSLDVATASEDHPVSLMVVSGPPLGAVPSARVKSREAHAVLTGGYLPAGADAVIQSERVKTDTKDRTITVTERVRKGEFVFSKGRDIRKGELVLERGRVLRGTDQVLLASLHLDRIGVYRKPRVAIVPTGNELSSRIRGTEPGMLVETHSILLSRLVEGAGGVPVVFPIARDVLSEIELSMRRALRIADVVLTLAGSSVGELDLTEKAIADSGKPGVLVHGMKVFRGRVMGFGAVEGKVIVILPGPIQGAVNAFALMAYPVIRSFLGRGFEEPPSLPATVGGDWDAANRYPDFTKLVYAKLNAEGAELVAEPSKGESEKITHMTRNDGYILVGEDKVTLKRGERVRVHLLPGLSGCAI
jgi:molybdopterin biosynthesis enzyme